MAAANYRLTVKQKWHLVLALIVVYFPVLQYLDYPVYNPLLDFNLKVFYYQLAALAVVLSVFFLWINVSEWVLDKLFVKFGEGFLLEFKLPAQLTALTLAAALAVTFVMASGKLLQWLDRGFREVFLTELIMPFPKSHPEGVFELYKRANISFILFMMLSGFYLIANRRANLRMKEIYLRSERLEKESARAQLAALKDQVSPHFLFNSLGILTSLVHENPELSEKFIYELSKTYRYILEHKKYDTVMLDSELDFIRSYVFLLKIRFDNKFELFLDIPEAAGKKYKIAPMTLQLLVENAVKHNQMSAEIPLWVRVTIESHAMVVSNNLKRRSAVRSTGLGLQNIITRYSLLTSDPVRITNSGEMFTVTIPLLPNKDYQ